MEVLHRIEVYDCEETLIFEEAVIFYLLGLHGVALDVLQLGGVGAGDLLRKVAESDGMLPS